MDKEVAVPEQRAIQANQTTQAMPVTHMASDLVPVAEQSVVVVVPHLRHTKMAVVEGAPATQKAQSHQVHSEGWALVGPPWPLGANVSSQPSHPPCCRARQTP